MNFGLGSGRIGPVKPGACGALLKLLCAHQRGQRQCHAVQCARDTLSAAFFGLEIFPACFVHNPAGVAENVRVADFHFRTDRGGDIVKGEMSGFFSHASVEYDLKE